MLRTRQFYQLWLTFVLSASAGLLIIGNIAIIAKDQAHWERGFLAVMTVAIFNTCGRVLSGGLSDRLGRTHTMMLASIVQAVNMFAFTFYTTPGLILFGSAMTGFATAPCSRCFPQRPQTFMACATSGSIMAWCSLRSASPVLRGPSWAARWATCSGLTGMPSWPAG